MLFYFLIEKVAVDIKLVSAYQRISRLNEITVHIKQQLHYTVYSLRDFRIAD